MLPWRSLLPTRRWLQFRLRTLFLLATALCIYLAWPHLDRQYAFWRLCQYGDKDFSDLWTMKEGDVYHLEATSSATEVIEKKVNRLLPYRHRLAWLFDGRTWFIKKMTDGRARLMIVKIRPPMNLPGEGDIRVVLLDGFGRIIADRRISTENRMIVRSVQRDTSVRPYSCFVIDCDGFFIPFSQRQYIAVRGERIAQIRIIRTVTNSQPGWWRPEHLQLGPEHRFPTHAAWSDALASTDQIDILEALLHLPPREAIKKRDLADIARLTELSRSPGPWIREGASAALAEFGAATKCRPAER